MNECWDGAAAPSPIVDASLAVFHAAVPPSWHLLLKYDLCLRRQHSFGRGRTTTPAARRTSPPSWTEHHHVPHSTSTEYKDMDFPTRRDNHNFVLPEGLQTNCYDRAMMEKMVKEYMIRARPSQSTNQTTAIGRKLRNMDQTDKLLIQKQCHCVCPDEKSGWRPGSDRRGRPVLPRHGRHLPGRVP